jgi:hypothetical protein
MAFLLQGRALGFESPSGVLELRQHAPEACLKAPLLGGWQLGWDPELGQVDERLADLLQAAFLLDGGG